MIETIRQGLKEDDLAVPVSKLCRWIGVPRRTVYYRPTKKAPAVRERFAQPIKRLIEEHPAFGYRTVAHLLGFNKNTVQRVFQADAMAGEEAIGGLSSACAGDALSGRSSERTMRQPICAESGLAETAGPRWPW